MLALLFLSLRVEIIMESWSHGIDSRGKDCSGVAVYPIFNAVSGKLSAEDT